MKNLKLILPLFLFAMATLIFACGDGASKTDADAQGKEYTSAYICTMHCKGSGSDKPGTCPVCPMEYVVNENYKGEGTESHGNHDGHDHGDHEGHEDHEDHEGHNH